MSIFANGSGDLTAATKPAALFELAQIVDAAENSRNAANPGIAPKQNMSVTVDFGTRTAAIAATIPAAASSSTSGQPVIAATDYLGSTYSTFDPGTGGDLKSTTVMAAFLEMALILSNAEKAITPVEDQPNNIQVTFDGEAAAYTVSANLPVDTAAGTAGAVVISAVDYL